MRAAIFERQGLDNLNVKVKSAGVNPIDYLTVSNIPGIKPLPHIPGAEVTGVIEKVGNHVATLRKVTRWLSIIAYLMEHAICVLVDMKCYAETLEY
jgi:NADPH:quinone reductase-like Zn-dependent oxidoreductase